MEAKTTALQSLSRPLPLPLPSREGGDIIDGPTTIIRPANGNDYAKVHSNSTDQSAAKGDFDHEMQRDTQIEMMSKSPIDRIISHPLSCSDHEEIELNEEEKQEETRIIGEQSLSQVELPDGDGETEDIKSERNRLERIKAIKAELKELGAEPEIPQNVPRRYSADWLPQRKLFPHLWATDDRQRIHKMKSLGDILATFFLAGILNCLWWRGLWYLMDIYFVVDGNSMLDGKDFKTDANVGFSLALGFFTLWLAIELRGSFVDAFQPQSKTAQIMERFFTYICGFAAVCWWRGTWYFGDFYVWGTKNCDFETDAIGCLKTSAWVSQVVTTFILISLSSLKSIVTGLVIDGGGFEFFSFWEMYLASKEEQRSKR